MRLMHLKANTSFCLALDDCTQPLNLRDGGAQGVVKFCGGNIVELTGRPPVLEISQQPLRVVAVEGVGHGALRQASFTFGK